MPPVAICRCQYKQSFGGRLRDPKLGPTYEASIPSFVPTIGILYDALTMPRYLENQTATPRWGDMHYASIMHLGIHI